MPRIRELLSGLEDLGGKLTNNSVRVQVDPGGAIILTIQGDQHRVDMQMMTPAVAGSSFDLLEASQHSPALVQPREHVSIAPGTLSGQPHVTGKRIPTDMVADMADQGFEIAMITEAYPSLEEADVRDAIAFEHGLAA
jgi:uncharacterized protein (DUF433 family)